MTLSCSPFKEIKFKSKELKILELPNPIDPNLNIWNLGVDDHDQRHPSVDRHIGRKPPRVPPREDLEERRSQKNTDPHHTLSLWRPEKRSSNYILYAA